MSVPTDEETAELIRRNCSAGDTEAAHAEADDILCGLLQKMGYTKTVEAWDAVDKWYA